MARPFAEIGLAIEAGIDSINPRLSGPLLAGEKAQIRDRQKAKLGELEKNVKDATAAAGLKELGKKLDQVNANLRRLNANRPVNRNANGE